MIEILVKNSENKVEVSKGNVLETILGDKYKDVQLVLDWLVNKVNNTWEKKRWVDQKTIDQYNQVLDVVINHYIEDIRWDIDKNLIWPIEKIINNWPKIQPEIKSELETKVKPEPEQESKQKSQPINPAQETLIAGLKKIGFMPEWWKWLLSTIDSTKRGI